MTKLVVYNIEDFIIEQMFRPYRNIIANTSIMPTDRKEREQAFGKLERELRAAPCRILCVLKNNRSALQMVFRRLAKMDIRFYKWLSHPFIDEFNSIYLLFKQNKTEDCEE